MLFFSIPTICNIGQIPQNTSGSLFNFKLKLIYNLKNLKRSINLQNAWNSSNHVKMQILGMGL